MSTGTTLALVGDARTTGELLAAGLDGDQDAWGALVDRLQGAVWGATSRLGLSQDQADDVFQTVWLRLLDRHETIQDPERLAGWLQTTARNEGLALIRRESRDEPSEMLDLREGTVEGPEADATRRATSELMMVGFRRLDDECQRILWLLASKVSYKEIARHSDIAVGSIGPKRDRCLKVLRSFSEVKQAMEPST